MTEKYIRTTSLRSPYQKYVSHICIFVNFHLLGFGSPSKYVPNLLETSYSSLFISKMQMWAFKGRIIWEGHQNEKISVAFSKYLNFIETTRYRRLIQCKHIPPMGSNCTFSICTFIFLSKGQLISEWLFDVFKGVFSKSSGNCIVAPIFCFLS